MGLGGYCFVPRPLIVSICQSAGPPRPTCCTIIGGYTLASTLHYSRYLQSMFLPAYRGPGIKVQTPNIDDSVSTAYMSRHHTASAASDPRQPSSLPKSMQSHLISTSPSTSSSRCFSIDRPMPAPSPPQPSLSVRSPP